MLCVHLFSNIISILITILARQVNVYHLSGATPDQPNENVTGRPTSMTPSNNPVKIVGLFFTMITLYHCIYEYMQIVKELLEIITSNS